MQQNNKLGFSIFSLVLGLSLTVFQPSAVAQRSDVKVQRSSDNSRETARLEKEIRHELLTLPWYGVFDWLEGNVGPDGQVILRGWVVRPTTKSDAEARVKEIEGVNGLKSDIQVLPLSPNDDRIRRALYNTLFNGNSQLFRYALGANPSIHIIVNNGKVMLKGIVSSEADRNYANIKARGVSGVFEVKNELEVEGSQARKAEGN